MSFLLFQSAIANSTIRAAISIELPVSLEGQRKEYERMILSAREEVLAWFSKADLPIDAADLIDRAVVYPDTLSTRKAMVGLFGVELRKIPDTFGGTVNGKTLYLVSREGFLPSWMKLYPDWPWDQRSYQGLIVHELAHRAHTHICQARMGSEDMMGPSWFFEGLAVMCAGQFFVGDKPMNVDEILTQVGKGKMPKVSYPLYGHLVRSLSSLIPVKSLVESAAKPDFPEKLLKKP